LIVQVSPLILPVSSNPEDQLGSIRLRLYQSQLRRCSCPRILLTAPTASGKTLAYLLRAIEKPFGTTIIVYPTNALMTDQAFSLYNLLTEKLGKRVNLTFEVDDDKQWRSVEVDADVDLYVLNGETLAALAEESRSSEGKALIEHLRRNQAESRIILTNPEILYYMYLYKFAKMEDLIDLVFNRMLPNLLVFDEFHLYHGYTLATVTYMLAYIKKLFDQIIFSSATPINLTPIIQEEFCQISAEPSDVGDLVRYSLDLNIEGISGILGSKELPTLQKTVDEYYEENKQRPQNVKVLIILNSLMTCLQLQKKLEEKYPNQVTPLHSLVPPRSRPKNRSEFKDIVVGTSAIEVGVDFDTPSLIIEAHDSSTFIQRLGRGARHADCYATAFVPQLYLTELKKCIPNGTKISPMNLNEIIRQNLPNLPSYSEFALSEEAAPILLAVFINWVKARPAGKKNLPLGEIRQQIQKLLENHEMFIPAEIKKLEGFILKLCKEGFGGEVFTMADTMSCRSTLDSIPAFILFGQLQVFDQISIQELLKVNYQIIDKENLIRRGIRIPWRMRLENRFAEVYEVKEKETRLRIDVPPRRYDKKPAALTHYKIQCDENDVEEQLHLILDIQPAFKLTSKKDWRLQGFYTQDKEFLAVGGDAYLAWYIANNLRIQ
jgi:hypothetical protein